MESARRKEIRSGRNEIKQRKLGFLVYGVSLAHTSFLIKPESFKGALMFFRCKAQLIMAVADKKVLVSHKFCYL